MFRPTSPIRQTTINARGYASTTVVDGVRGAIPRSASGHPAVASTYTKRSKPRNSDELITKLPPSQDAVLRQQTGALRASGNSGYYYNHLTSNVPKGREQDYVTLQSRLDGRPGPQSISVKAKIYKAVEAPDARCSKKDIASRSGFLRNNRSTIKQIVIGNLQRPSN